MLGEPVEDFLQLLKNAPSGAVFNPWWQVDKENDIGVRAPRIRRQQLRAYFFARLEKSRLAIVGEALGYRGGHFTGIAMTSERILLGENKLDGLDAERICGQIKPERTSKPRKSPHGFSEPTATIIWSTLSKLGLPPEEFILWNAFPWHSFDQHRGLLSNRTPNKAERSSGLPALKAFLKIFPCEEVVALGRIAASQLENLNMEAHCVRHPASGGAKLFRHQIASIVAELK